MRGLRISYLVISLVFTIQTTYSWSLKNVLSMDSEYGNQLKTVKKQMEQMRVEAVSFESQESEVSEKKIKRKAFLALRPNALGTIVFCHGYTHSKHEAFFFKTFFPNFHALAFDFRAHGELTNGQYSTIGADEIHDVAAAVEFVKAHPELKDKPVIGFGFSMGAVSLLRAQARWGNLFDALIVDTPFESSTKRMSEGLDSMMSYKFLGRSYRLPGKNLIMKSLYSERMRPIINPIFRWISSFDPHKVPTKFVAVEPIDTVSKITIPCMFIACVRDGQVPVEAVRSLYDNVGSSYKRMWITQGVNHCTAYLTNPELYWYRLNKFVKKVLDGPEAMKVQEKIVDDRVTISVA